VTGPLNRDEARGPEVGLLPGLDPGDRRPTVVRAADLLRAAITAGVYPLGGLLPGTEEIAAHWQVSKRTVSQAMRILAREGLVYIRTGVGMFVGGMPAAPPDITTGPTPDGQPTDTPRVRSGRRTASAPASQIRARLVAPTSGRKRRRGMPPQVLQMVHELALAGYPPHRIAPVLTDRFGYNPLAAMRLAHGLSQRDAADAWNDRWPDELKTFKNFSYWETFFDGSATGYAVDLRTLGRLAQLYQCAAADLIAGYRDHRPAAPARTAARVDQVGRAALARAHTLTGEVTRRWPHAFASLDRLRARPPGPWPSWCLLPTTAAALVLADPGPAAAVVSALYAWRLSRSVYRYPEDLAAQVWHKPADDLHTRDPLHLLPEWCVYVAAAHPHCPAAGLYAYLDHHRPGAAPLLRLVADPGAGGLDQLITAEVPLDRPLHECIAVADTPGPLADLLDKLVSLAVHPADATLTSAGDHTDQPVRRLSIPIHDTVYTLHGDPAPPP